MGEINQITCAQFLEHRAFFIALHCIRKHTQRVHRESASTIHKHIYFMYRRKSSSSHPVLAALCVSLQAASVGATSCAFRFASFPNISELPVWTLPAALPWGPETWTIGGANPIVYLGDDDTPRMHKGRVRVSFQGDNRRHGLNRWCRSVIRLHHIRSQFLSFRL